MDELTKLLVEFVVAGGGAYLGSYLKKKGENLATHEDIGLLVDQVRAVTVTAKEIEAKISNDVWDRQKLWELKREVLFETTRRVALVDNALSTLYAVYITEKKNVEKGIPERLETESKALSDWSVAASSFEQTVLLADLVCGEETKRVLHDFSLFNRERGIEITHGQPEVFPTRLDDFSAKKNAVTAAIRKELGVKPSQ